VLDRALGEYFDKKDTGLFASYNHTALQRIWRGQWFSWWMTSMLRRLPGASDFDLHRQVAELRLVMRSATAANTLADNYTGLPLT
jgi:p-hydroxybenzoate 3-monooxygenase